MGKVTVTFETDNAAFVDDWEGEANRILTACAVRVAATGGVPVDGLLLDSNGNVVGSWKVEGDYTPPTWADMLGEGS